MGTLSGAETISHSCFQSILSARLLDFGFEHDRRRARDAAIFSYAPEVDNHQHRSDDWNADAMPDVRTQEIVCIHDRAAEQSEANIVIGRNAQQGAEWPLVSEARCSASHVGTDSNSPETELIVGQQVSGE